MVLAPHGLAMKCSDTVSPHESSVTNNLFETLHFISSTNSSITYNITSMLTSQYDPRIQKSVSVKTKITKRVC